MSSYSVRRTQNGFAVCRGEYIDHVLPTRDAANLWRRIKNIVDRAYVKERANYYYTQDEAILLFSLQDRLRKLVPSMAPKSKRRKHV